MTQFSFASINPLVRIRRKLNCSTLYASGDMPMGQSLIGFGPLCAAAIFFFRCTRRDTANLTPSGKPEFKSLPVYCSHTLLFSTLAALVYLPGTYAFADESAKSLAEALATSELATSELATPEVATPELPARQSVAPEAAGSAKPEKIRVGSPFPQYTLEDQHGKKHVLAADAKTVLISTNMELSKSIHTWLKDKNPTYLTDNKIEYVSDITDMPGIISWMFAKPKMRKFPFQILLAEDENFAPQFPQQEGKLAVFQLKPDRTVAALKFVSSMDELQAALPPAIPQSDTSVSVVNEAAVGTMPPKQTP